MVTKITWLHLSTGIPLSQPIASTYQLIPIGLLLGKTIRILLLLRMGLLISHCWEAHRPSFYYPLICWESAFLHLIIEKHSSCHSTVVSIPIHQYSICWDATFLDSIPLGFEFPLIALQLQANAGSSYRPSLVNPIAVREVDNSGAAMRAWALRSTRDLANGGLDC